MGEILPADKVRSTPLDEPVSVSRKHPRRVLIHGFAGTSRYWAADMPKDVEIWCLNESHICSWSSVGTLTQTGKKVRVNCGCTHPGKCTCRGHTHSPITRYSRWFQIHPRNWNSEKAVKLGWRADEWGRAEGHEKFLATCDVPVFMQDVDPAIPTSIAYPFEAIQEAFGTASPDGVKRSYLTSTPAYMLALALYEEVNEIFIAGIDLAVGNEYFFQRPCFEYYLGIAKGRGIPVHYPPQGCPLLNAPIYAVDEASPQPDAQGPTEWTPIGVDLRGSS